MQEPKGNAKIPAHIGQDLLELDNPPWEELKKHPQFNPKWVTTFLKRHKAVSKDALEQIAQDTSLIHHYAIVVALIKNRSFPQTLLMRFAEVLRWSDILVCLRLSHITISAKTSMVSNLMQRYPFFTLGEKIAIAKKAPQILIGRLRTEPDPKVMNALLQNPNFSHPDAMFLASSGSISPHVLNLLADSKKWIRFKDVRMALLRNGATPRACYRGLLAGLDTHELRSMQLDHRIPRFAKVLAQQLISPSGNM